MLISTYNREINICPELIISFSDILSQNYISEGIFLSINNLLYDIEIEVRTLRDGLGNFFLSSILFRNNLEDFFYDLDLRNIKIFNQEDNLMFSFNDLDGQVFYMEFEKELDNNLGSNISINYIEYDNKKIIKNIIIENYIRIIDKESLKLIKFKVYDYEKVYDEGSLHFNIKM